MVFTNEGIKKVILTAFNGGTIENPTHIGIGTDETSPSEEDIALGNEKDRLLINTTYTGEDTYKVTALLTSTEQIGETLREVGSFSADSAGTMSSRSVHAPIIKTSSVEVEYIFTFKVTN